MLIVATPGADELHVAVLVRFVRAPVAIRPRGRELLPSVRDNRGIRRRHRNGKKYRVDTRAALGEHAAAAGHGE